MKINPYRNWWKKVNPARKIDSALKPFLKCDSHTHWLYSVRSALCLSTTEVARRLNVNRATYWRLEKAEQNKTISLRSLHKIAEVMDCELVYCIRPKTRIYFGDILWHKILPIAKKQPWMKIKRRTDLQKYYALQSTVSRAYVNPSIRRYLGWSRNF